MGRTAELGGVESYTRAVHVPRLASGTRPEERQPSLTSLARARLGARARFSSELAVPPSCNPQFTSESLQPLAFHYSSPRSRALLPSLLHSRATLVESRSLGCLAHHLALLCSHPVSRLTLASPSPARLSPTRLSPTRRVRHPHPLRGKPTLPPISPWDTMKTTSYISINLSIP